MLAMAHVAGGDAMIACFDAKYHYWFWRPYQAIHLVATDGNPDTVADPTWQPLGATPNFPEYPSAHARHSTAVVGPGCLLRHRQDRLLTRQPRARPDRDDAHAHVRPPPRHRQGRRLGARPRRLPLPQLRPTGLRPRTQGRPLRRRPLLPAARLKQDPLGRDPTSLPSRAEVSGPEAPEGTRNEGVPGSSPGVGFGSTEPRTQKGASAENRPGARILARIPQPLPSRMCRKRAS
jgi:hypothetical protein